MSIGKKMIHLNGTENDDFIFVFDRVGKVTARKGDDFVKLGATNDVVIDGGFGHDTFEFYLEDGQDAVFFHSNDFEKFVIKIFDEDTGERLQKIVLHDFEQINWPYEG